jgi:hypothetical protein
MFSEKGPVESYQPPRKTRTNLVLVLICALALLLIALCMFVPGFGLAIYEKLTCAFGPFTCIKIYP